MNIGTAERTLIEQRVTNDGPNVTTAYLLWFFLGLFSGHRFYLGKPGTAVLQMLLNFVIVGWVWTFIDLFLIPGMVRDSHSRLRNDLAREMAAMNN